MARESHENTIAAAARRAAASAAYERRLLRKVWKARAPKRQRVLSKSDPVQRPAHYALPNGLEAIDVLEALHHYGTLDFRIAAAIQYLWRLCIGKEDSLQDAKKAVWYIKRWVDDESRRKNGVHKSARGSAKTSRSSRTRSRNAKRKTTAKSKTKKRRTS